LQGWYGVSDNVIALPTDIELDEIGIVPCKCSLDSADLYDAEVDVCVRTAGSVAVTGTVDVGLFVGDSRTAAVILEALTVQQALALSQLLATAAERAAEVAAGISQAVGPTPADIDDELARFRAHRTGH
jgi:hypothetical protein